jgi:hypothetical protein
MHRKRRSRHHRPAVDRLESRQLLSVVNSTHATPKTTRTSRRRSEAIRSSPGSTSSRQPTPRPRPADRPGLKQVGPKIIVKYSAADDSHHPTAAIDSSGTFVVAWTQVRPNGNRDILARRFNDPGIKVGPLIEVHVVQERA